MKVYYSWWWKISPILGLMFTLSLGAEPRWEPPQVAAGGWHTLGLHVDGTVLPLGLNDYGQCNVDTWTNIVQVDGGAHNTIGLKADGTVVAVGQNLHGENNVNTWTDIVQINAGERYHTVGLKEDGTVLAIGWNNEGQCNVDTWTGIEQIAAGGYHTIGLKADGTVVAAGWHGYYDDTWTNIEQISAAERHTVGVKDDGTVVAYGSNVYEQYTGVDTWTNIVQVSAAERRTVGLKTDGTVVAVGWNGFGECDVDSWSDIVQIDAGFWHTLGLKADGTVVATGYNYYGQCDVGCWNLIYTNDPPTAVAGDDQSIRAGELVHLDGSNSFDDNTPSNLLTYEWIFSHVPEGSATILTGADTATPTFFADLVGSYIVALAVTDECGLTSEPDLVTISSDNLAPTAYAEVDPALVVTGNPVQFDGSGSVDPEGDPLTYVWTITVAPADSNATLSGADTAMATLTPDVSGGYEVTLIVSDDLGPSDPLAVEATAANPEEYVEIIVVETASVIADLPPTEVTTAGNQNALGNFLSQVVAAVQAGDIEEAIDKLQKAMERTDGCVIGDEPDGNGPGRDWITNCEVQQEVYAALKAAKIALEELLAS